MILVGQTTILGCGASIKAAFLLEAAFVTVKAGWAGGPFFRGKEMVKLLINNKILGSKPRLEIQIWSDSY